ncbi:MAG TPA: ABC transporter permease [Chloroflexota bacterium]|jgi:peptide/nickel transport system permease protein|nr:ABC transporter permease [Chloroflexota bacterium]
MQQYIIRRLLITVPTLLMVTVLLFTLLQLIPGDPLDAYAPPDAPISASQRMALRHELGFDQPPAIRYFYWLRATVQGNLGLRATNFQPVSDAIGAAIGPTLVLMGTSIAIAIALGLLLGVLSAARRGSFLDILFTLVAYLGISMPPFFVGLVGLYVFALLLHWFPAGGFATPGQPFSLWDHLDHLILPAIILSVFNLAAIMRYTRSSMLEVIGQDYIRTAYAKGLTWRAVVGRHALRNALLPIVTVIGAIVPSLLGGAVFIESVFSWPGMGQLYLAGVQARDYSLVMGITLIIATAVLLANLLTDIAYAVIDPRVRYG